MGQLPGAPPWLGAGAMKNPSLDTHDNTTTRSGPHTAEELRALLKIYQSEGAI